MINTFVILMLLAVNTRSAPTVLVVGDSLMRNQLEFLRGYESIYMAATTYVPMTFPTAVSAKGATIQHSSTKFDVVYIDFGALHLLQLHPVRPFSLSRDNLGYVSDFIGFMYLENWMKTELAIYQRAAKKVVVMTPNRVCTSKFDSEYEFYINNARVAIGSCIKWLDLIDFSFIEQIEFKKRFGTSVYGNISETGVKKRVCTDSLFDSRGSYMLSERMKRVVKSMSTQVGLVDSFALTTAMGCNHTEDGRHYSLEVIRQRLTMFKEVVIGMNGRTSLENL